MLSEEDYAEACRRYKDKRTKLPERQRYHALILTTQGYSYREVGRILLVDEESVSEWVARYQVTGLDALQNHPAWGGEHRQRFLSAEQLEELKQTLTAGAMAGTKVGSGWTAKAIRKVIRERYAVSYSKSGVRKLLCELGWSYQRGRKLYIRRSLEERARFVSETQEILAKYAESGERVVPLAGDQSKVYLEATLARRWNPRGQQPLVADGARQKQAENIYGAIHLGTGQETSTFCIDWQDSGATIEWLEMLMAEHPRGQMLLWLDGASHHTSDEVEEWLETHPRLSIIHFPAYEPEENPKEATWKALKEEVSHHHWHETIGDLKKAINDYYQTARQHTVNFLERFGYGWSNGKLYALRG
ncbi:MAG TPA: IS630 family transposase [Pyrinomonadaceae bacterium]|nr:IS630 family transposase [Pyrinomonadaceae bacterium]